jgi:hypothetical protein
MQFIDTRNKPKKAGVAKLEFIPQERGALPKREGDTIIIPFKRGDMFHKFRMSKGEQFIFASTGGSPRLGWGLERLYFGGTDENPFLVELNTRAWDMFLYGEREFYSYLVPGTIPDMQKITRTKYRRQGDIFSLSTQHLISEVVAAHELIHGSKWKPKEVTSLRVFGTRHLLNGIYTSELKFRGSGNLFLAEGVITAEDHAPMELEGMHILAQANGLTYPKKAD